jgi:hypothetical protein
LTRLRMAIPETEAGQEMRFTLREIVKMKREADALEESLALTGDREVQKDLKNIRVTIGKLQDQVKDLPLEAFGIKVSLLHQPRGER